MFDLIILTDKPVDKDSCALVIKETFSKLDICEDSLDCLYMKSKQEGFELWFTPNDILDDPQFEMGETIEKCPNKKAFMTTMCYSSAKIAKQMIEVLQPLFGNMWIQSNEEDEWFGSADQFIKKYLDK